MKFQSIEERAKRLQRDCEEANISLCLIFETEDKEGLNLSFGFSAGKTTSTFFNTVCYQVEKEFEMRKILRRLEALEVDK